MKTAKIATALALCLMMCAAGLSGCGSSSASSGGDSDVIIVANSPDEVEVDSEDLVPLEEATNFTFDFESLDYSFTGVENAEFYYIRVYPMTDGEQANSASFQSDKIDAADTDSYEGTIEDETLLAGDYIACVVASGSGYSSSEVSVTGTSTLLANPSLSARWNTGDEGDENAAVTADITITPGDAITETFTLSVTDEAGEEVYRDEAATAEPVNLTAADLGAAELTVEDVYNVTVTVNPVAGYTVPAEGVSAAIEQAMMFFGP